MKSIGQDPHGRTGWRLLLGVNLLWLPLSMLFNSLQSIVLPVYVLQFVAPAQKATALGLLLFVGLAAGAIVQPVVGAYSDRVPLRSGSYWARWGRRQPLILGGTLLTLAFLAGFAFASSLWVLAVAYTGISVAAGIAQAGAQGLLPDLVPAQRRGRASGLKGLLELTGSLAGFSLAGMLIKRGQPAGVLLAIGLLLVIGVAITIGLLRASWNAPAQRANSEPTPAYPPAGPVTTMAQDASQERLPAPSGAGRTVGGGVFGRVLVSRFLFLLGVYGIGHFLLYYLRDRLHLVNAAAAAGGLLAALTLVTALLAVGGGLLSDRIGRLPVLWAAGGLSALGALLLIPAGTMLGIAVGGIVMSIGSGLFASANWALTADLTPSGEGGRFFGLLALATGGAAAAAGLFGPLVDHVGYSALFVAAAVAFGGSVALLPRAAIVAATRDVVAA